MILFIYLRRLKQNFEFTLLIDLLSGRRKIVSLISMDVDV